MVIRKSDSLGDLGGGTEGNSVNPDGLDIATRVVVEKYLDDFGGDYDRLLDLIDKYPDAFVAGYEDDVLCDELDEDAENSSIVKWPKNGSKEGFYDWFDIDGMREGYYWFDTGEDIISELPDGVSELVNRFIDEFDGDVSRLLRFYNSYPEAFSDENNCCYDDDYDGEGFSSADDFPEE